MTKRLYINRPLLFGPPEGRLDDALHGACVYYLTSLVMFLGFSLGYEFFKPTLAATRREAGFVGAFDRSSGRYYNQIVQEGYQYQPQTASNVAFFPVYPLLARAVVGATGLQPDVALLLVSNLSLFAAFIVLARYLRERFPISQRAARNTAQPAANTTAQGATGNAPPALCDWTLVALGLFPTGCFFRMCYAESTFLLLTVIAMFGLQRLAAGRAGARASGARDSAASHWLMPVVVLVIGLATATRATGVALVAPLAVHIWQGESTFAGRVIRLALWLPLACWGLIAFMAFQYVAFGDPLAIVDAQVFWRNGPSLGGPAKLAALATLEPLRAVYDPRSPTYWANFDRHGVAWFSLTFANPLYFIGAAALLAWGAWRRWLTLGETALTAMLLLIPYLTRAQEMGMLGAGRFVAVAFPLHIILGQLLSRLPGTLAAASLAISAFFLAVYAALFAAGYLIV